MMIMGMYYIGYTKGRIDALVGQNMSLASISCEPYTDSDIGKSVNAMVSEGLVGSKKVYSSLSRQDLLSKMCNGDMVSEEITNFQLLIGGKAYTGINDNSYTFEIDEKNADFENIQFMDRAVYFGIKAIGGDKPVIATANERSEFHAKYPRDEIIRYGKAITLDNDAMISDYMLERFGVPKEDFANIIGQKVSVLYCAGGKETVLLDESYLCGILSQNFFRIENERYSPQFIVSVKNKSLAPIEDFDLTVRADVPDFRRLKDYAEKMEGKNVADVYYDGQTVSLYRDIESEKEIVSFIFMVVAIAISTAFVVNIYHLQYYHVQRKKYFFGLLGAIGMPRRDLWKLLFYELCFIAVASALLSITVSLVLLNAISSRIEDVLSLSLTYAPLQFVFPSVVILSAAPAVSCIIACCNTALLHKEDLAALLNKSTVD
jgi:ABC-type antimicrobial peptide transport system permease subunit